MRRGDGQPQDGVTAFVGKLVEEDDPDPLREGVRVLAQMVMETEVSAQIWAGPYEAHRDQEPPTDLPSSGTEG